MLFFRFLLKIRAKITEKFMIQEFDKENLVKEERVNVF